jgi:hypothetical protein
VTGTQCGRTQMREWWWGWAGSECARDETNLRRSWRIESLGSSSKGDGRKGTKALPVARRKETGPWKVMVETPTCGGGVGASVRCSGSMLSAMQSHYLLVRENRPGVRVKRERVNLLGPIANGIPMHHHDETFGVGRGDSRGCTKVARRVPKEPWNSPTLVQPSSLIGLDRE